MIYFALLGKFSFHRRSLHHISSTPNPYEQAISIIGQTLSKLDEDNLILVNCFLAICYGWELLPLGSRA